MVATFPHWYSHRHRHSGIKFVKPHERDNDDAVEICRHRAVVYEQARHVIHDGGHDPHAAGVSQRWSGSIHLYQKINLSQLYSRWLLEQQQVRYLSWQ